MISLPEGFNLSLLIADLWSIASVPLIILCGVVVAGLVLTVIDRFEV